MTLPASAGRIVASGNGVTTGWPYNFLIPAESDLVVTITEVATAISTTLLASQYSVTGINNPAGGTVTYPLIGSPLPVGWTITIQRIVPYEQDTDLTNQDGFYADVIENALDYLTMQTQQLADDVSRALVEDPYGAGTVDAFSNRIINVANGTGAQDAATYGQLTAAVVAAGNVPAPGGGGINALLKATGAATWAWVLAAVDTANIVDSAVTLVKRAPQPYASLASAATTDLTAQTVDNINITGTTTITSFGNGVAGRVYNLKFAAALTITNSANIVCVGGVNFVTEPGDVVQMYCVSTGVWEMRYIQRFAGGPANRSIVTLYASGSGNHTWQKWTRRAVVEMVGGGGAGGGAPATAAGQCSVGQGGGAGAFIRHLHSFTSDQSASTVAYAVGAGGSAGAAGSPGNAGSNTTWALGTLTAGGGGGGGSNGPGTFAQGNGGSGGTPTNGNVLSQVGANGGPCHASQAASVQLSGWGGNGPWGGGGALSVGANAAGNAGTANTGGGGSGANNGASQSARAGAAGGSGLIIVWEYAG